MLKFVIGFMGCGILIGSSFVGLYKVCWYLSRKEQEKKKKQKIKEIDSNKNELMEHLEKLNNHKVLWKNN